ncbi:MAG: ATP-binding protein [Spirochaetes bacterium]|nr:MAG: ATP-binding protein [Spirochaetota bacterium]
MLTSFSVGNFKSYREIKTINLLASADNTYEDTNLILQQLASGQRERSTRVLKSSAIYGANASGKSNLLEAIRFMKFFSENSSKNMQASEKIPVDRFILDNKSKESPAFFQIQFFFEAIPFRYGFEITSDQVISEWLFYSPKGKEAILFTRSKDSIEIGSQFPEGRKLEDKTRKNALFLSVCAQFNGELSNKVIQWFSNCNIISGINDKSYIQFTIDRLGDPKFIKRITNLLQVADLGITDITYSKQLLDMDELPLEIRDTLMKNLGKDIDDESIKKHKAILNLFSFIHKTSSETIGFKLESESQGTQKLFALAGPIIDTLNTGKTLIVDEFDTRLHPNITRFLIGLFNSKDQNKKNAQLIFATHDTNLLSNRFFRRDQIWFTEKNKDNESDLYPLSDIKVRKDATFNKDYIQGKYGAIPYISTSSLNIVES